MSKEKKLLHSMPAQRNSFFFSPYSRFNLVNLAVFFICHKIYVIMTIVRTKIFFFGLKAWKCLVFRLILH